MFVLIYYSILAQILSFRRKWGKLDLCKCFVAAWKETTFIF